MSIFNIRKEHINFILNKINEDRKENLNCDCLIRNGDQVLPCHEVILHLASPIFKKLLEKERKTSNSKTLDIDISNVTRPSHQFGNILDFIYTGKVEISNENVFEIIRLATVFEIDLVKVCCNTIMELLDVGNIGTILQAAHQMDHTILIKMCNSFLNLEFYNMENSFHLLKDADLVRTINDPKLVLWNRETNNFFVGLNYAYELERILKILLEKDLQESECAISEDTKCFLQTVLGEIRSHERNSKFLTGKTFAVPSELTAPVKRFLPFGMHPLQCGKILTPSSTTVFNTIGDCSPNMWKIRKITLYLVPKWNNLCSIVAGMDISYQMIWDENETKTNECQIANSDNYEKKEINLTSSENITKLRVSHSWVINSLLFETDQGNIFGPYGDPDPPHYDVQTTHFDIRNLNSEYLYLHGFYYIIVMSSRWKVWNQVSIECSVFDIPRLKKDFSEIADHLSKQINLSHNIEYHDDLKPPKRVSLINLRPLTF